MRISTSKRPCILLLLNLLFVAFAFVHVKLESYAQDHLVWRSVGEKSYWYENGIKQGTYDDPQGVLGDDGKVRGREIYDPTSGEWYWLDSIYDGAKAIDKEVWMPYIFQNEAAWDEERIQSAAALSGDMANQVADAIRNHGNRKSGKWGKWVRYDHNGAMIKGWYKVQGADVALYPDQAGNVYYYDPITGLMAHGNLCIDGKTYHFGEITGVLDSGDSPFGSFGDNNTGNNSSDDNNYSLLSCNVGDIVSFGSYEQDNIISNGAETIQWVVLAKEGNKALLTSRCILDCRQYNSERVESITWEQSSLRSWMNNVFLNNAFNEAEKSTILNTAVHTENNSGATFSFGGGGGQGGNDTYDKVFCLTWSELKSYFAFDKWMNGNSVGYSKQLLLSGTEYAISNGLQTVYYSSDNYNSDLKKYNIDESAIGMTAGDWWLRYPGSKTYYVGYVAKNGGAGATVCDFPDSYKGVRPAIWVKTK